MLWFVGDVRFLGRSGPDRSINFQGMPEPAAPKQLLFPETESSRGAGQSRIKS